MPHRPAKASTDGQHIVETRRAVEKGDSLLGAQVDAGVVLVGRRVASFDAENELAELVLQPDLAAGHGGVVVRAEASARHTDDCQRRISIGEKALVSDQTHPAWTPK